MMRNFHTIKYFQINSKQLGVVVILKIRACVAYKIKKRHVDRIVVSFMCGMWSETVDIYDKKKITEATQTNYFTGISFLGDFISQEK